MSSLQPLATLWIDFNRSLAQQLIGKEGPAHADLAMDTPDRELDLLCIKRSLPGKNMLIDAVDQRAIEVEQKGRFDAHYECSSLREYLWPIRSRPCNG